MTNRKRHSIALTLPPDALAILDAESARTGLPRSRIVESLLRRPDLQDILSSDTNDHGMWMVTGPDGRTQSAEAWARELGIPGVTIRYRLRQGWPDEKVLSKEYLPQGRPKKSKD